MPGQTSQPRAVLELQVREMRQLFNAMYPAPFRERDLDAQAVAYILDWGRDTPAGRPLGLAFLGGAIMLGERVAGLVAKQSYSSIIRESFVIGGWVALWRPLEIFLYDGWPIRAEARLQDRLAEMDVRVRGVAPAAQGSGA